MNDFAAGSAQKMQEDSSYKNIVDQVINKPRIKDMRESRSNSRQDRTFENS